MGRAPADSFPKNLKKVNMSPGGSLPYDAMASMADPSGARLPKKFEAVSAPNGASAKGRENEMGGRLLASQPQSYLKVRFGVSKGRWSQPTVTPLESTLNVSRQAISFLHCSCNY